jgi:hypothetical protein
MGFRDSGCENFRQKFWFKKKLELFNQIYSLYNNSWIFYLKNFLQSHRRSIFILFSFSFNIIQLWMKIQKKKIQFFPHLPVAVSPHILWSSLILTRSYSSVDCLPFPHLFYILLAFWLAYCNIMYHSRAEGPCT